MPAERPLFIKLLKATMMAYGKSMPETDLANFWWEQLAFYPMPTVEQAISDYRLEERNFAPIPNAIIARCAAADGRPSADEAWATVLESRDEAATVVWTEETAMSLPACTPILDAGDKIGARRAFIESYNRLVLSARGRCLPVKWMASLGDDKGRQLLVLNDAVEKQKIAPNEAFVLPAPPVLLLPGLTQEQEKSRDLKNLARLKVVVAGLRSAEEKLAQRNKQRLDWQDEKNKQEKERSLRKFTEFSEMGGCEHGGISTNGKSVDDFLRESSEVASAVEGDSFAV